MLKSNIDITREKNERDQGNNSIVFYVLYDICNLKNYHKHKVLKISKSKHVSLKFTKCSKLLNIGKMFGNIQVLKVYIISVLYYHILTVINHELCFCIFENME